MSSQSLSPVETSDRSMDDPVRSAEDQSSDTSLVDTVAPAPIDLDEVAENIAEKGEPAPGNFA